MASVNMPAILPLRRAFRSEAWVTCWGVERRSGAERFCRATSFDNFERVPLPNRTRAGAALYSNVSMTSAINYHELIEVVSFVGGLVVDWGSCPFCVGGRKVELPPRDSAAVRHLLFVSLVKAMINHYPDENFLALLKFPQKTNSMSHDEMVQIVYRM